MDTLVSLGTLAAHLWSAFVVLTGSGGHVYFEVAAVVTGFLLAGRYAGRRLSGRRGGVTCVAVAGRQERRGLAGTWRWGFRSRASGRRSGFVVRPGERVATDGVVIEGRSDLDMSAMTGESVPVDVGPGDEVLVVRSTRSAG